MKINQELLDEANKIDFKIKADGALNARLHNKYERGLWFIKKAVEVHGIDTYQYGKVLENFNDVKSKVPVLCPEHGEFLVTPGNHVGAASGCPKCSNKHSPSTEEWIESARKVHGDRYDYSGVVYIGARTKIRIRCKIHGVFEQAPSNHIYGQGCARCYSNYAYTTSEWVEKAKAVHGDRYDYSNVVYSVSREKVLLRCLVHGDFLQEANAHLSGRGCPKCAGKNQNILYLLKCLDTGWYKIGITTDNMQKRITSIGGNIEDVFHVVCENPREHETYLHKRYKDFNVFHEGVRNGNTEFFSLTKEQVAKIRQYMASIAINQKSN